MQDPIFIIFGASGNLACTKLFPALYTMFKQKKLTNFAIVGASAGDISINDLLANVQPHIIDFDQAIFDQFKERIAYLRIDFTKPDDFNRLHALVQERETNYNLSGNRILYCAVAAEFFCAITQACAQAGLLKNTVTETKNSSQNAWHRIVYEKPFGHDAISAHTINLCLAQYAHEDQIYRIDHYLTKELVGNIGLLRFTNCIFEPLWNNRYIDNVQIILSEKIGLQGRGAYYDKYGALADMVQNHVLELVALIGMEAPEQLSGECIRIERAKVLEKIEVIDGLLGQYEGYLQEPFVSPNSKTETFAQLQLKINNLRWRGVPFYIKTGKHLDKKETVIHIKFKQVDCLLTKNCPSDSNYLTIQIFPDASFFLILNAKQPGYANQVVPVKMEFCHHCIFGSETPESYEVIFEEIIKGEHSVSVRFDEIEYAWKVIDTIKNMQLPLYSYQQNSRGPQEASNFEKKHGMRWRS